nr:amidohydrolase family protein [Phaeacidiphilus oryzae]
MTMVIDAHHHFWDPGTRRHAWLDGAAMAPLRRPYGVAELRDEAERSGVDGTVLVQVLNAAEETAEFLATAEASELVRGVVGWVDLRAPDVADRLDRMRELPGGELLVGVRHLVQDEPDPEWLLRADVRRGLRAVGAAGLVVDLVVRRPQWDAAARTVRGLDEVPFVLDHLGKPRIAEYGGDSPAGLDREWADWLTGLAATGNLVAAKLSGLVTEASWQDWTLDGLRPYADAALESFGPDRLMFGSDWPVCRLAAPYVEVAEAAGALTAGLSTAEREAVFGGTARRVYGV